MTEAETLNREEARWVELIRRFPTDPRSQLERELRITEAILNPPTAVRKLDPSIWGDLS